MNIIENIGRFKYQMFYFNKTKVAVFDLIQQIEDKKVAINEAIKTLEKGDRNLKREKGNEEKIPPRSCSETWE